MLWMYTGSLKNCSTFPAKRSFSPSTFTTAVKSVSLLRHTSPFFRQCIHCTLYLEAYWPTGLQLVLSMFTLHNVALRQLGNLWVIIPLCSQPKKLVTFVCEPLLSPAQNVVILFPVLTHITSEYRNLHLWYLKRIHCSWRSLKSFYPHYYCSKWRLDIIFIRIFWSFVVNPEGCTTVPVKSYFTPSKFAACS